MIQIRELFLKLHISVIVVLLLASSSSYGQRERRDYIFSVDTMIYVHKVLVESGRAKPYDGLLEEYYPGGRIKYRIVLDNGVPTGKYTEWYPDSTKYSEFYFDELGQEQGVFRIWFKTGELYLKGYFVDGFKDSTWLSFNKDSTLLKMGNYKNGLRHGRFEYFTDDGRLWEIEIYKNDTLVESKEIIKYFPAEEFEVEDPLPGTQIRTPVFDPDL